MWFSKDDIFRIYDLCPVGIERPPRTTASSSPTAHRLLYIHHKDNKTPNIQKCQKCPEFRLSQHQAYKPSSRIQKSQIRAEKGQKRQMTTPFPYACARKTLTSPQKSTTKKIQKNIPKKVGNSLKIKNLQNLRFLAAWAWSAKTGTPPYMPPVYIVRNIHICPERTFTGHIKHFRSLYNTVIPLQENRGKYGIYTRAIRTYCMHIYRSGTSFT